MTPTLATVLTEGYDKARAAGVALAAKGGLPGEVATEAVSVVITMLSDAGLLLGEPVRAPAPPTPSEAAMTLCLLSRHPRLTDEDTDYDELLVREDLVDFAWSKVLEARLGDADLAAARAALGVLRAHHRGQPRQRL